MFFVLFYQMFLLFSFFNQSGKVILCTTLSRVGFVFLFSSVCLSVNNQQPAPSNTLLFLGRCFPFIHSEIFLVGGTFFLFLPPSAGTKKMSVAVRGGRYVFLQRNKERQNRCWEQQFGVRGEGRLSYNNHLSAVEAALAAAAAAIRMETMVVATNQTIN
ncbi:MAG: hypothetical protein GY751_01730 [Bacteroidetes bacterium]|nr:hypothetical protein [Bacteroidota bacterium]